MIHCFVSFTTKIISAVLLRLIYSCFDIALMALFCVAIKRDSIYLLKFPFLAMHKSFCIYIYITQFSEQ